ncbi:1735_t:CDS:2, partial [Gigaspora rosea]
KIRDRFKELNKRSADSLIGSGISNYSTSGISFVNLSNIHPAEIFRYAFVLFYDCIHLVQILSMFFKTNSTFNSYIDVPVKAIDLLSYISVKVIYYLGKSAILQENSALGLEMVTLQS